MAGPTDLKGDLQVQVMDALWRLGSGTVEQVRSALPKRYRGAYTTVQTVLNRLAERDLLNRERRANVIVYRPRLSEAEFLSRSIESRLASASPGARQSVLAGLIDGLGEDELSEVRRLAADVAKRRRQSGTR